MKHQNDFTPMEERLASLKHGEHYTSFKLTKDKIKKFTDSYQITEWVTDWYDSDPMDDWETTDIEKYNHLHDLEHKIVARKATKEEQEEYEQIYKEYESTRMRFCNWQDVEDAWCEPDELVDRARVAMYEVLALCEQDEPKRRIYKITFDNKPDMFGLFFYLRDRYSYDVAIMFNKKGV